MTPPSLRKRLYKKEYAKELLKIAEGDFESARALANSESGRPENIIFLVQQSVEKYTKAVLVHLQIGFPNVHDLGILVALFPDEKMPPEGFGLSELNPFATVRRYEEGRIPLTIEEIESALMTAKKVADWANAITKS